MSEELKADRAESEERQVKVTDKRMFGPDGELREEYRFLDGEAKAGRSEKAGAGPAEAAATATGAAAGRAPEPPPAPSPEAAGAEGPGAGPAAGGGRPLEIPTGPAGPGSPSFLDLLSILAEPVAVYLGDVPLPDGQSAENLDMARVHIDLLDVLRRKTAGNLTAQEGAVLEDLLYRLRMRYVQKRG